MVLVALGRAAARVGGEAALCAKSGWAKEDGRETRRSKQARISPKGNATRCRGAAQDRPKLLLAHLHKRYAFRNFKWIPH